MSDWSQRTCQNRKYQIWILNHNSMVYHRDLSRVKAKRSNKSFVKFVFNWSGKFSFIIYSIKNKFLCTEYVYSKRSNLSYCKLNWSYCVLPDFEERYRVLSGNCVVIYKRATQLLVFLHQRLMPHPQPSTGKF